MGAAAAVSAALVLLAFAGCAVPANNPAKFSFATTAERVAAKAEVSAVVDAGGDADGQAADMGADGADDVVPDVAQEVGPDAQDVGEVVDAGPDA